MARKVRTLLTYKHYLKQQPASVCNFCNFDISHNQVLAELPHFWVVKNIFPYSMWDNSHVTDHIMVVPKRHVYGVSEFTDEEQREYVTALSSYEKTGYAFYTRNPGALTKSVPHQHTHAIQLGKLVTPLSYVRVLI